MKKVCFITATRAEYGSLFYVMKEVQKCDDIQMNLIVTGAHLSSEFGLTYKEIEKDFIIDKKVEMLLSSDSAVGVSKAMGLAQISFSEKLNELNPDLVVILGDRYEMLSVASTALILGIPIVHLCGGEKSEGAFDESIRHAITKLSTIHCVTTKEYKKRVIQLGENPKNVFNVGGLGIDNINKMPLLSKNEFEKSINFQLNKKNILVTFHPITLEKISSSEQCKELLKALSCLKETNIIFTKANADNEGRKINQLLEEYVAKNTTNCILFDSLGQLRYLSALQYVDAVVGNSSSGFAEAPSFKIGTINIGNRQNGRVMAKSILNCKPTQKSILKCFKILYSKEFIKTLKKVKNPYGTGGASKKIATIIQNIDTSTLSYKKFYDL